MKVQIFIQHHVTNEMTKIILISRYEQFNVLETNFDFSMLFKQGASAGNDFILENFGSSPTSAIF